MGGWKKRGEENLTNDTPPNKGVWAPLVRYVFSTPSGAVASVFLYKNPRLSRPEALSEGSRIFREGAVSGTSSSPHTFCTPPYHGPTNFNFHGKKRQRIHMDSKMLRNARLFIILFVRNFWRDCSQFWLSVHNSV